MKTREEISKKVDFYTKELERIDKLATQASNFTDANIDNEEKKKRLSLIEKRLSGINSLIENEYANLAISQEESTNTKAQIDEMDTDEPVLNWSKLITDKRLKFFGANSATKKLIKYKGIPYVDVKLSKSNGRFFDEIKEPTDGAYETKYRSEKGRDGLAKVEIYVKKRDLPDNVKIIKYLRENVLAQFQEEIDKANEQIRLYNAEKEYCNQAKKTLDKGMCKEKLILEKTRIKQKIDEENDFLSRLNERDQKYAKINEKSKNFILDNAKYFEMISIIDNTIVFNSNLVTEFLNYYEEYTNIYNDEIKHPDSHVPNNHHEENYLTLNFYCPISGFLMTDPWVNVCGHSFEYSPLIEHIRKKPDSKCPNCTRSMSKQTISPNKQLKEIINHWQKKQLRNQYSHDQNEDKTICDENEFERELESKKVVEEEIRQLKINLEMKEFRLKEIDQRIERWIKKRQKNVRVVNRFTVEENARGLQEETSSTASSPPTPPPQKYIPPSPQRPIPEPPKVDELPYVYPTATKSTKREEESKQETVKTLQVPPPPPLLPLQKQQETSNNNRSDLLNDIKAFGGNVSRLKKTNNEVNSGKSVHENKLELALKNALENNRIHHALSDSDSNESSDSEYEI